MTRTSALTKTTRSHAFALGMLLMISACDRTPAEDPDLITSTDPIEEPQYKTDLPIKAMPALLPYNHQQKAVPIVQVPDRELLEKQMNPLGLKQDQRCTKVDISDPVAAAKARMAQGDLRPFMINGFMEHPYVHGLLCDREMYRVIPARGGTFSSDIPDVCGGERSFSGAATEDMVAYNRTLATNSKFRELTSCRALTDCEIREQASGKNWNVPDARCPESVEILSHVASHGSDADFIQAINAYLLTTPATHDGLTRAAVAAISTKKWDRARMLFEKGADVNGRLTNGTWLEWPVAKILGLGERDTVAVNLTKWLFIKGANFTSPQSDTLGNIADFGSPATVEFMLAHGAPVNGIAGRQSRSSDTPLEQLLRTLTRTGVRGTEEGERNAARGAVLIYAAGGRIRDTNSSYGGSGKPSLAGYSILLAIAAERHRFKEALRDLSAEFVRYEKTTTYRMPHDGPELKATKTLLARARKCSVVQPRTAGDHLELC